MYISTLLHREESQGPLEMITQQQLEIIHSGVPFCLPDSIIMKIVVKLIVSENIIWAE